MEHLYHNIVHVHGEKIQRIDQIRRSSKTNPSLLNKLKFETDAHKQFWSTSAEIIIALSKNRSREHY